MTVCSDYQHPGRDEPRIGTRLDPDGGEFHGGPWEVYDFLGTEMTAATSNTLKVDPVNE